MAKYPEWEYELLRYLGTPAPLTNDGMDQQFGNSLLALNLWAQSEGSVTNNALATSGRGTGATTCVAQCGSSSPIYEYDNVADGVAQMGRFLQGSFYTKIVSALLTNASLSDIYAAINSSPWCKGCQNGRYPTALATAAGGGAAGVSGSVGTGSSSGGSGGGSTGAGANPQAKDLSACKFSGPSFDFLFFKASTCLLSQGQWKAVSGAVALASGVVIGTFGVVVLAAYGFSASGAKQSVTRVAGKLPTPIGRVIKASGGGGSGRLSSAGGRSERRAAPTAGLGPSATPPPPPDRTDRRFEQAERDMGTTIGPRGGVPGQAARRRQGASMPGARPRPRRQPSPEERRARAAQPF